MRSRRKANARARARRWCDAQQAIGLKPISAFVDADLRAELSATARRLGVTQGLLIEATVIEGLRATSSSAVLQRAKLRAARLGVPATMSRPQ